MRAILKMQRSEVAKQLRRRGIEAFANREYVCNTEISNTITTVCKDNLIIEQ